MASITDSGAAPSGASGASRTFTIPTSIQPVALLGPADEFLKVVEQGIGAQIMVRGNQITVTGADATEVALAGSLFEELVLLLRSGQAGQPGRALGSGPRGRWFESTRPDQFWRSAPALRVGPLRRLA